MVAKNLRKDRISRKTPKRKDVHGAYFIADFRGFATLVSDTEHLAEGRPQHLLFLVIKGGKVIRTNYIKGPAGGHLIERNIRCPVTAKKQYAGGAPHTQ